MCLIVMLDLSNSFFNIYSYIEVVGHSFIFVDMSCCEFFSGSFGVPIFIIPCYSIYLYVIALYVFVIFVQVAGVPGVTETLFLARQSALAEEKRKLDETPMVYSCGLCGKGYRSFKAHAQHLKSKSHLIRASEATSSTDEGSTIIKPLTRPVPKEPLHHVVEEDDESEWEEVDPDEFLLGEASDSLQQLQVHENLSNVDMDEDEDGEDDFEDLDPSRCFMCDLEHDTIESCMVHMHKLHGFFIPDIEYLKDPKGLLTYLSLKVTCFLLSR